MLRYLKTKLKKCNEIIESGLGAMKEPYLSLSWGKDSTLLMHLVLQQKKDIPCVYINSGYALPDAYEYRDMMLNKYDINYIEIQNQTDYIELCKEIGLVASRRITKTKLVDKK